MFWRTKLILLCCIIGLMANAEVDNQDEEEDFDYYLNRLFADSDGVDIHDMLSPSRHAKKSEEKKEESFFGRWTADRDGNTVDGSNDGESCNYDKKALAKVQEKYTECQVETEKLQHALEAKQQQLVAKEKTIRREGNVDMQIFYKRAVRHVWDNLNLEEANDILKSGESAVVRKLTVLVTKDSISTLQEYLKNENNALQVDEFLGSAFQLEVPPIIEPHSLMSIWGRFVSAIEVGKNVETWLYLLCSMFIFLGIWAVFLFIRDIQQELRWTRVIWMMIVLIFFICCLWHWRHMHRVAESRRHAQMVKRGFTSIPEECKPGARGTAGSVWEWLKVSVIGAPDVCEQYFEELMVDPLEEITPGMVIAETLSKFFFQPLQHLGSESAKFISNFYSNIPYVYQVPATIFFLVVLIIVLFAICGYGIDFPLWMGGIRPIYRPETTNTTEVDRITREALAQIQRDRETFMIESRNMLTSITQAATSTQGAAQPLLVMSSGILETKLEHLISQQFTNVLANKAITNSDSAPSPIQGQISPLDTSGVYTVTSTPLGRNSSFEVKEKKPETQAQSKTPASHQDIVDSSQGGARPKEITPRRSTRSSSRTMSQGESSPFKSVREMEKRGSSSRNTSRDMSMITNSSQMQNQSRECSNLQNDSFETSEEVDKNTSVASESFIDQVKKILEESLNSNTNDSIPLANINTSVAGNTELEPEEEQELELSTSSVKFLSQIKKIMTP